LPAALNFSGDHAAWHPQRQDARRVRFKGVFSAKRNGANQIGTCYIPIMPKTKPSGTKARKTDGFVIGRDSFAKISAVEGIRLTPAMKKRATDAERKGLSAEEYCQTIVRSYRKG
jgi:hypothetical protein